MKKFKHHKVKLLFSSAVYGENQPSFPFAKGQNSTKLEESEPVPSKHQESEANDSDSDGFENVEDYCEGPALLGHSFQSYRLMMVGEEDIRQKIISKESLPTSMQEALLLFQ
jgi:hypothetical protein